MPPPRPPHHLLSHLADEAAGEDENLFSSSLPRVDDEAAAAAPSPPPLHTSQASLFASAQLTSPRAISTIDASDHADSLVSTLSCSVGVTSALALLLLACRLGWQTRRRGGLAPRVQLLCGWVMMHLALQRALSALCSHPFILLVNEVLLCAATVAAVSGDWWLAALANLFPSIFAAPSSPILAPQATPTSRRASLEHIVVPSPLLGGTPCSSSSGSSQLSSAASHNKNLLRLAKARLQTLDAEYAKTVEESTMKGAFMAFLCHELRNPLQVITANTDFLLEEAASGSPRSEDGEEVPPALTLSSDQRDLITSVNSSAELMLSIVNDVLDASRLQSGRMAFERLPIDLPFICHSIIQISRSQASAKGLRLTLHIDDEVPRYVISDPTRIHQLLLNLISNAIKFTTAGGVTLTVRASRPTSAEQVRGEKEELHAASANAHEHRSPIGLLHSDAKFPAPASTDLQQGLAGVSPLPDLDLAAPLPIIDAKDESNGDPLGTPLTRLGSPPPPATPSAKPFAIELDVTDTGCGIAPEHLSKLFQPYSQATLGTQREHGGSGLGLAICTQIVKLMRGRIDVTSQLGKGSTFHCRLLMDVCDDEDIRRGLGTAGSFTDSPDLRQAATFRNSSAGGGASPRRDRSARSRRSRAADPSTERVLVVDDHEVNCKLLARMVTSLGFACDIARDGFEAIEMLKTAKAEHEGDPTAGYMCAFLDLNMPRCDGWTCLATIRDELCLKALPVVALTAETLDPARAIEKGFSLCLAKPFRKPALQRVLEAMLAETRKSRLGGEGEEQEPGCNPPPPPPAPTTLSQPPSSDQPRGISSSSSAMLPTSPHTSDALPSSPRFLDHHRASSALSMLHQATLQASARNVNDIAEETDAEDNGSDSTAKAKRVSPPLTRLRLEDSTPPMSTLPTPQVAAGKDESPSAFRHVPSRSVDLDARETGCTSGEGPSHSHAHSHARTRSESHIDTTSSSPLRPSSRQLAVLGTGLPGSASAECTPSSHRRSLRDSPSDRSSDSSASPQQLARVESLARRLRGGAGHYSPLALSASPMTVPRHLIIEPSPHPARRPPSSSHSSSSSGGSASASSTPSPQLRSTTLSNAIADSIVPGTIAGHAHGAPAHSLAPTATVVAAARMKSPGGSIATLAVGEEGGLRRRMVSQRKDVMGGDDQAVPAGNNSLAIPPLHPQPPSNQPTPPVHYTLSCAPSCTPSPLASPTSCVASPLMATRALSLPSVLGVEDGAMSMSACSSSSSGSGSASSLGSAASRCRSGSDAESGSDRSRSTTPTQASRTVAAHLQLDATLDLSRVTTGRLVQRASSDTHSRPGGDANSDRPEASPVAAPSSLSGLGAADSQLESPFRALRGKHHPRSSTATAAVSLAPLMSPVQPSAPPCTPASPPFKQPGH